jgi:3-oxoacyl-[acyl-carrier-protein] synthase-3
LDKTTKGRNTAVIFADGAGAVVVSASDEPDKGILSTHIHADGRHAAPLSGISPYMPKTIPYDPEVPGDGVKIYMDGQYVFKHAVTKFPKVIVEALESAGLSVKDLDLLIPHQANLRITQAVGQRLGLPEEKVVSNIQKYGNTTAASIPIAMSEAWRDGRIKAGTNVCIASFGAGFTWGAAVIRF